ncbi:DNA glycosylase AlkZ-like family protein [Longispora albida]|uniref:DNA glycosylase AlkZ-like family protein n=1 Tax=Longispora albida TaxID=203523 RepID=UPI0003769F3D|nr:crosslink repair DNA glycosylase YcaQ family protein [Longispora albida]
MAVHQLSRADARRIAVRAQLLDGPRPSGPLDPTELPDLVRQLTFLQVEPTSAVAPSADVVAWSRLGSGYVPAELRIALADRVLVELHGMIRPAEDVALFRAEMAAWSDEDVFGRALRRDWVQANDACRRDLLARLDAAGPLAAAELPDTCVVPWQSSGWSNNRNVRQMLAFMVARGEVALAGRRGRDPLWDLADRVYPGDPAVPLEEALRIRSARRLRTLGIARARGSAQPGPGDPGEPAVIEGVRGTWRVDPELLGQPFTGRAALLSPLDQLVFDRKRMAELFEFDYQLEMYKPAAQRKWGYWAMPILSGDRLVGKLDATADRKAGVLRVGALHQDEEFDSATSAAVHAEIEDLATWLRLDLLWA